MITDNIYNIKSSHDEMEMAVKIGDLITDRLDQLGSHCEIDIDNGIDIGPRTYKYNLILAQDVLVKDIVKFKDDLQYELGANSLRILAPVPGRRAVGIEIDRPDPEMVTLGQFTATPNSPLTFPLGITPEGEKIYCNLPEMGPHLLVAGTTGSGKSSMLNSMICSLIGRYSPNDLSIIMLDTKMVELTKYEGIDHLATPVVTDAFEAPIIFDGIVNCMNKRYEAACRVGARNLAELNEKQSIRYPHLLVVCDELADLMMMNKAKIEDSIVKIAQKARAMGIHFVLATQSPRREIVTGILKCNMSSRLAFATSSELDSRIILDQSGASQLLGSGDALFSQQGRKAFRLQSPLITTQEIERLI
jgi:DNA segregation ATPase FtsK/SpoIIIE, S-DNA-T family